MWNVSENKEIKNIIIVEDDAYLKSSILRCIKNEIPDADVVWVESGESAIELIKAGHEFDLWIVDFHLSHLANGIDVWKKFKNNFFHDSFIMVSGMSIKFFLGQFYDETRVPLFLPKPFREKEIVHIIKNLKKKRNAA